MFDQLRKLVGSTGIVCSSCLYRLSAGGIIKVKTARASSREGVDPDVSCSLPVANVDRVIAWLIAKYSQIVYKQPGCI